MTIKHILVIDDNVTFGRVISQAFMNRGLPSTAVTSLAKARKILAMPTPIITHAILDLNIGEENGLDLLAELISQQVAVVILTGYASLPTTVYAIKQGAVNYLAKPATADEILSAFNDLAPLNASASKVVAKSETLSLKKIEWEQIQRTLHKNSGNVTKTAQMLGMHRRTLQRKLKKHRPV
jgi:two-component system response regulator RegA